MKEQYDIGGFCWQDRKGNLIYSASASGGRSWCYVHQLSGSWGYTVWKDGVCLSGRADWNWTFFDAGAAAAVALREVEGTV